MKALIINGSPRKKGDTAKLILALKNNLYGEIVEISAYYDKITPCVDCRKCWEKKGCAIDDDMTKIYNDDFDTVVIASPLYMSNLTGPLISLASRFQAYYAARRFLRGEINIRNKNAILMLVGGGDGEPQQAFKSARRMFKAMNAELSDENIVLSLHTDTVPVEKDIDALNKVNEIAFRLNHNLSEEHYKCGIFSTDRFRVSGVERSDIPDIIKIYNSNRNFLENHLGILTVDEEWVLNEQLSMALDGFSSCKIANLRSGEVVGLIDFKLSAKETYLSLVILHDDCKNQGAGKEILRAFENYIMVYSDKLRIDVVTSYDDSVMKFWLNAGFTVECDITLLWGNRQLPAAKMTKSLSIKTDFW